MNKLILYQKFLNERRGKRVLHYDTLDEVLLQNHLTEELTIENSNINLAETFGVLEKWQFLSLNILVPISPKK